VLHAYTGIFVSRITQGRLFPCSCS